jgi:hypothetical protein
MDLFSILCTTCKSRLKVRDEAAVGHILACPKCGGMVMVRPPEGWKPGMTPAESAAVSTAASGPPPGKTAEVEVKGVDDTHSESHFEAVDDLLSDAPPRTRSSARVEVHADAPGLARPRFVGAPTQPPPKADSATTTSQPAAPSGDSQLSSENEFPPDWLPRRPRRYWVLVAGSVAGGVALAVAVVLAINASRGDASSTSLAVRPGGPAANPASNPVVAPQPLETDDAEIPATPQPLIEPRDPSTAPPVEPVPSDPPPEESPPMPPVSPPMPEPPQPAPPAASGLADLDRILAPDSDPLDKGPVVPTPGKAPLPPPDPAGEPEPERPALPRPAPREVDIATRLADPLPGIETDGTPLADFLQVLSDLSTIPITLEPDALPLVGASANSPITLKLSGTTIGAALATGVRQLKLEAVELDGQLIVRLGEPAILMTRAYSMRDLTGGDAEQMAELADLFRAVVEPSSWSEEDGAPSIAAEGQSLKIRQRAAAHAQVILLADTLRVSRGQPPAATWLDPALFRLDSRSQVAQLRLQTPVTVNFSQPTQLVRILKRLEEAAAVRILVDWRDIAAAGWNPDGEATLSVEKQPLGAALTSLVEPMDLAWRIVDGGTLQIVRPETLASRCEVEFYQVADLLPADPAGESLLARVKSQLGDELFHDRGGSCDLRCDAAGQCLIALLPQPKQQELEAVLTKLRSDKK